MVTIKTIFSSCALPFFILLSIPKTVYPFSPTITPVPGQPFEAGAGPYGVAYSANGRWLAVANNEDMTLSSFIVNNNGSLTPTIDSPFLVESSSYNSVQYSPDSNFLAAASERLQGQVSIFAVNPTTGSLRLLQTVDAGENTAIAVYSPNGRFLAAGNSGHGDSLTMFSVNSTSGLLNLVGSFPITTPDFALNGTNSQQIAFSPDSKFLALANLYNINGGIIVCSVNQTTGAIISEHNFDVEGSHGMMSVAYSPNGKFLVAANEGNSIYIFSVNQTTGALKQISSASTPNVSGDQSASFSPDSTFVAVTNAMGENIYVFSVTNTGQLSPFAGPLTTGTSPDSATVFSPVHGNGVSFFSTVNSGSNNVTSYALKLYDTQSITNGFSSTLFKAIRTKYFEQQ